MTTPQKGNNVMTRIVIQFRCTDEQKQSIESKAALCGVSVASYLLGLHEGTSQSHSNPIKVISTPTKAKEIAKELPRTILQPKPKIKYTAEDLWEKFGVKKTEVEGVDYWFNGNRVVRPNLRS